MQAPFLLFAELRAEANDFKSLGCFVVPCVFLKVF